MSESGFLQRRHRLKQTITYFTFLVGWTLCETIWHVKNFWNKATISARQGITCENHGVRMNWKGQYSQLRNPHNKHRVIDPQFPPCNSSWQICSIFRPTGKENLSASSRFAFCKGFSNAEYYWRQLTASTASLLSSRTWILSSFLMSLSAFTPLPGSMWPERLIV